MSHLLHNRRTSDNHVAGTWRHGGHEHVLHNFLDIIDSDVSDGFQDAGIVLVVYAFDDAADEVELACCCHCALLVLDLRYGVSDFPHCIL